MTGIMEKAQVAAVKNGHTISSIEQCVDTVRSCCIDCGAEIVVGLDEHLMESYIAYDETISPCDLSSNLD